MKDTLKQIFDYQQNLNDTVFKKHSITGNDGKQLSTFKLFKKGYKANDLGPNSDTNQWLRKYCEALEDELRELKEELLWKWWSKDEINMQNTRVEIIDLVRFLVF